MKGEAIGILILRKVWSSPCDPHGGPTQTCRIRTWVLRRPKDDSWAWVRHIPWRSQEMIHKMKVEVDDWLPRWGPHGGNAKSWHCEKKYIQKWHNGAIVYMVYQEPRHMGVMDGEIEKAGRDRLGDGGQDCGALLSGWKVWFFSIYIFYWSIARWFSYTHTHNTYIIFQGIISTIGYYKILTIGPVLQ